MQKAKDTLVTFLKLACLEASRKTRAFSHDLILSVDGGPSLRFGLGPHDVRVIFYTPPGGKDSDAQGMSPEAAVDRFFQALGAAPSGDAPRNERMGPVGTYGPVGLSFQGPPPEESVP